MSAASRPPLTVLLGSGFSQSVGLPSTNDLTDTVRGIPGGLDDGSYGYVPYGIKEPITFAQVMWRFATSYYSQPNFETIFHLAESALAYTATKHWLQVNDRAKPAYGAFTDPMPQWVDFLEVAAHSDLLAFINASIEAIAARLISAATAVDNDRMVGLCNLIGSLNERFRLTAATLNYDDLFERCVEHWVDGFQPDGSKGARFVPKLLIQPSSDPVLLHLHGSVRFYVLGGQDDDRWEILRANGPDFRNIPTATRRIRDPDFAQSGDSLVVGPMITGLRKTDKVTRSPYGYYQYSLHDALMKSPRLLIVGYGGGDVYLNALILEMQRIHGDTLRVAFILHHNEDEPATYAEYLPGIFSGYKKVAFVGFLKAVDIEGKKGLPFIEDGSVCATYSSGLPISHDALELILDHLDSV